MENTKSKAIKVKLANLIASTPRDICLRTRLNRYSFDLVKYFNAKQVEDFFSGNHIKLEISALASKELLKTELENLNSFLEFDTYLKANEILLPKTKLERLEKRFEKNKPSTIEYILNKVDSQRQKIEAIIRSNKNILANTGIFSLYIGAYFLSGLTDTDDEINAPIVLYPINVYYDKDVCVIEHYQEGNFVVNEKLLSFLKHKYGFKTIIADLVKYAKKSNDASIFINELKRLIAIQNIDLTLNSFNNNPIFVTKDKFNVNNSAVLGIFEPTGGALKYDLERLIELDVDPFVNKQVISKVKFINDEINNLPLVSMDGHLNIYQKYAIRSALAQNTLIYGPPGTGKSEVITNIIANALVARKSTLVVAEKRVALDVILERLKDLANFTLFIPDLKNKSVFYEKIQWVANSLENMYYDQQDLEHDKQFHVIDCSNVNKSHSELKKYFTNLQNLLNCKDSNQTSFLDYLALNEKLDNNLLKFVKDNNSLQYLDKMLTLYSFRDITSMLDKVNEYKTFLINHKINIAKADQVLKQQKLELTNFQIKYNTISFLDMYWSQITKLNKGFINFIENLNLTNNKKFMQHLAQNPNLLSKQKMLLDQIKLNYFSLFNSSFLKYLIKNSSKLVGLFKKIARKKDSDRPELLLNFLRSTSFFKIVSQDDKNFDYDLYSQLIKSFLAIPHNDNLYLVNLLELSKVDFLDQNVVLMYFNPWLTNPYILDLATHNFTFFTNEELIEFNPLAHMTQDNYEAIHKIINFEAEIINNIDYLDEDIQQLVNTYRQDIFIMHENIVEKLAHQYLLALKQILLDMDASKKAKIQELFAIACRKTKGNVPIKEIIINYYNELKLIFPIWISLPELVAQLLPLKEDIFDYGIFDEASQIFLERAYPIVYRCRINVIAGDDKQLRPTSFFTNHSLNYDDFEYNDNDQVESLFDRAKVALWPEYYLRNHYRSVHRDLIQFSNDYIYDHGLHFVTKNGATQASMEIINVDGFNEEGVNEVEANTILELLKENYQLYEKIIVVTFGAKQSEYLYELLQLNSVDYPALNQKYNDGNLIITNLENAQGNEADLVILSVTYGKDKYNNFKNTFGPLLLDGGSNRLNVAITRAKDKMIVVKSFMTEEMHFNPDNPNAVVLRAFINYCDTLNKEHLNNKIIKTSNCPVSLIYADVKQILDTYLIEKPNYFLVTNYDIGSKVIDFAILDKRTSKTVFALIINKLNFFTNVNTLFESVDNYWFMHDRGYQCFIMDEHYWIKNKSLATRKIHQYLKNI